MSFFIAFSASLVCYPPYPMSSPSPLPSYFSSPSLMPLSFPLFPAPLLVLLLTRLPFSLSLLFFPFSSIFSLPFLLSTPLLLLLPPFPFPYPRSPTPSDSRSSLFPLSRPFLPPLPLFRLIFFLPLPPSYFFPFYCVTSSLLFLSLSPPTFPSYPSPAPRSSLSSLNNGWAVVEICNIQLSLDFHGPLPT